jgi:hypothetical protein
LVIQKYSLYNSYQDTAACHTVGFRIATRRATADWRYHYFSLHPGLQRSLAVFVPETAHAAITGSALTRRRVKNFPQSLKPS